MKVLIEISEDYYELIKKDVENHTTNYVPFVMIGNGIPLNGTNGDVLKAVFDCSRINEMSHTVWVGNNDMSFRKDFWNADYKGVE